MNRHDSPFNSYTLERFENHHIFFNAFKFCHLPVPLINFQLETTLKMYPTEEKIVVNLFLGVYSFLYPRLLSELRSPGIRCFP